jgi:transcriptional regulator with XRE-family HTH domain
MSFAALVKSRLKTLGYGQKDLARAVEVTDSYISQLLTRRKAPPGPERTDIYMKMEGFLQIEPGELGRLAELERAEELRRKLGEIPEPLFRDFRDLVLRKCVPEKRDEVRQVFEAQSFGIVERLVTRKLLEVVQQFARRELDTENWFRLAACVGGRSREELRVIVLEFLDADVFHVSSESCVAFLDPVVEAWGVDLDSLRLDIRLNPKLVANPHRVFAFVESEATDDTASQAVLTRFLEAPQFENEVTEEEARLLRCHRFGERIPTELYYYRALQNLRDPLHFHKE